MSAFLRRARLRAGRRLAQEVSPGARLAPDMSTGCRTCTRIGHVHKWPSRWATRAHDPRPLEEEEDAAAPSVLFGSHCRRRNQSGCIATDDSRAVPPASSSRCANPIPCLAPAARTIVAARAAALRRDAGGVREDGYKGARRRGSSANSSPSRKARTGVRQTAEWPLAPGCSEPLLNDIEEKECVPAGRAAS
eukprot:scaffold3202_cov407-Prasinococcus_capsulatus_cf.AAC.18